jgi:hypothetical protein
MRPFGRILLIAFAASALLMLHSLPAKAADDYVVVGTLVVGRSTSVSLTFELPIDGDADRTAAVAVSYRKAGTREWMTGPPMIRLSDVRVDGRLRGTNFGSFRRPKPAGRFFGSIPNLEPDTEYECSFLLYDADGAFGLVDQSTMARTAKRPE